MAIGVACAGSRVRVIGAVVLCAGLAAAVGWMGRSDAHGHVDTRAVASVLAANHRPGDAIVYGGAPSDRMREDLANDVPEASRPRDVLAAAECSVLSPCLAGVDRVWVLLDRVAARPLDGLSAPTQVALANYLPIRQWAVPGGTLALFTHPRP